VATCGPRIATALALTAGAVVFTASSCVQSPVERLAIVGQDHALQPPAIEAGDIKGRYIPLDLAYRSPDARLSSYSCLYIARPALRCPVPAELKSEDVDKLVEHLRHRLYVHMVGRNCFDLVTKNAELVEALGPRYRVCRLETTITRLSLGDPWLRYLVGLDVGGVEVQQEGQIVEAGTGQVLIEFADRRIEGGNPRFGFGFETFDASLLLRKAVGIQALAIAQYVRYHKGPLKPDGGASAPATQRLHDIRY